MEKRIRLHGNQLLCEVIIVLTASQEQKLECIKLRDNIDNISEELNVVSWVVEKRQNLYIAAIGRTFSQEITSDDMHQLEIAADNFMSAIEKLEVPEDEDKELIDFDENPENEMKMEPLAFVKKLLHDINLPEKDDRHVCSALIIDTKTHPFCPELTSWGRLGYDTLKEMCELYLKAHDHE